MPLQNWLLSQVTAAGCAHAPCPSHWSAVQAFPSSVQAVPAGVAHWVFSLQGPLLHSAPFTQGSPLCTHSLMFVSQDSVPLQKTASSGQSVFVRHGVCAQAVRPLATVTATHAPTSVTNDLILMPHPPKCRNRSATVARALRTLVVLVSWRGLGTAGVPTPDKPPSLKGNPYPPTPAISPHRLPSTSRLQPHGTRCRGKSSQEGYPEITLLGRFARRETASGRRRRDDDAAG